MDNRRPTRSPPTGRGIITANETRNAIGHAAFGSSLLFIIERCSRRGRSVVDSFVDDPASTVTREPQLANFQHASDESPSDSQHVHRFQLRSYVCPPLH